MLQWWTAHPELKQSPLKETDVAQAIKDQE
jgi:hypothetical protein